MRAEVQKPSFGTGERIILLVGRMLTATLLTGVVGAVENWFYERFFAPDLYAAGNPFARGVFLFAISFPFILVGLFLFGLPTAYALSRVRAESAFNYSLAGVVTGAVWGAVALGALTTYGIVVSAFYGCLCALFWWWFRPRG